MTSKLTGTVALVTGASSGIGDDGGTALVLGADITDRTQAEAAVQQTFERFGRLDILVNNAGLMLLGPVVGADPEEWDRIIAVNAQGLLYITHAALPYLLKAAEDGPRQAPTSSTSAPSPVGSRGTATASTT